MLREFQAEIERLKSQLASLEGGDPSVLLEMQQTLNANGNGTVMANQSP